MDLAQFLALCKFLVNAASNTIFGYGGSFCVLCSIHIIIFPWPLSLKYLKSFFFLCHPHSDSLPWSQIPLCSILQGFLFSCHSASGTAQPRTSLHSFLLDRACFLLGRLKCHIQAFHRGISGLVLDNHSKVNILKWVTWIFWLPGAYKSFIYNIL